MNGWRAIMRTILRSYAFRGLVGFALCPVPVLLVGLLASPELRFEPVWSLLIVALFLSAALLGGAFPGWLLIDDTVGRPRVRAAVAFGVVFAFLFPLFLAPQFNALHWALGGRVYGNQFLMMFGEAADCVALGISFGASVGFASLMLIPRMRVKHLHGFAVWLSGFAAFLTACVSSYAAATRWTGEPLAATVDPTLAILPFVSLALGGLLFGLALDLLAESTPAQRIEGRNSPHVWAARSILTALFLAVAVGGALFGAAEAKQMKAGLNAGRARAFVMLGRYDEAAPLYEALAHEYPADTGFRSDLAEAYGKAGCTDDAIREYREVLRLDPDGPWPRRALVRILLDRKRYDEAIVECNALMRTTPTYGYPQMYLGEAYAGLGREDDALRELKEAFPQAIQGNAGDVVMTYVRIGRYDDAIRICQDAFKVSPGAPGPHIRLGEVFASMSRNDDADREFKEAIRLEPKRTTNRLSLARVYERLGRYDDAIREHKEAILLTDRSSADWAHFRLAVLYDKLGRYDEAAAEYKLTVKYGRRYGPFDFTSPGSMAQLRLDKLSKPQKTR